MPLSSGAIQDRRLLYAKAALFVLLALLAGAALWLRSPDWRGALLLALLAWASARAYDFAFYVIEHYVDASCRYAGLLDLLRDLARGGPGEPPRKGLVKQGEKRSADDLAHCDAS